MQQAVAGRRFAARPAVAGARVTAFVAKWYGAFILALYIFIPEVRRLIDWQVGYNSLSFVTLLPMLSIVPLVFVVAARKKWPSGPLGFVAGAFAIVLFYGVALAWASGALFSAVYELAQFLLPLVFGLWIIRSTKAETLAVFERLTTALLWLAFVSSMYAIAQFISPSPWDVIWVQNAGLVSIGTAVPFGLRVFGTMNAPAIFADLLFITILLNLRFIQTGQWWRIAILLPLIVALALTFDRSGWLALVLGGAAYIVLTPQRQTLIVGVLAIVVSAVIISVNINVIFGSTSGAGDMLSTRIGSLGDLQNDTSATARQELLDEAWSEISSNPLGDGLGTVGTAAKLSTAEAVVVIDNGYIARLLEFGYFGFLVYLLAVIGALVATLVRLRSLMLARDYPDARVVATAAAIQIALIGIEISADHHAAFSGIIFWACVVAALVRYPEPPKVLALA